MLFQEIDMINDLSADLMMHIRGGNRELLGGLGDGRYTGMGDLVMACNYYMGNIGNNNDCPFVSPRRDFSQPGFVSSAATNPDPNLFAAVVGLCSTYMDMPAVDY